MLHKITVTCERCATVERLILSDDQPAPTLCKHCLPEGERVTGTILHRPTQPQYAPPMSDDTVLVKT